MISGVGVIVAVIVGVDVIVGMAVIEAVGLGVYVGSNVFDAVIEGVIVTVLSSSATIVCLTCGDSVGDIVAILVMVICAIWGSSNSGRSTGGRRAMITTTIIAITLTIKESTRPRILILTYPSNENNLLSVAC
jgi:hypothetical protein